MSFFPFFYLTFCFRPGDFQHSPRTSAPYKCCFRRFSVAARRAYWIRDKYNFLFFRTPARLGLFVRDFVSEYVPFERAFSETRIQPNTTRLHITRRQRSESIAEPDCRRAFFSVRISRRGKRHLRVLFQCAHHVKKRYRRRSERKKK